MKKVFAEVLARCFNVDGGLDKMPLDLIADELQREYELMEHGKTDIEPIETTYWRFHRSQQ